MSDNQTGYSSPRNHQGIAEYYERKAATAKYGGWANVDELRTEYERLRERHSQLRDQFEALRESFEVVQPLSPDEIRTCRALVNDHIRNVITDLKRGDLTETGRQQYAQLLVNARKTAAALEKMELAQ